MSFLSTAPYSALSEALSLHLDVTSSKCSLHLLHLSGRRLPVAPAHSSYKHNCSTANLRSAFRYGREVKQLCPPLSGPAPPFFFFFSYPGKKVIAQ